MMRYIYPFVLLMLLGCESEIKTEKQPDQIVEDFDPKKLPNDLSQIKETDFEALIPMLGDSKLIGISEGTHGMIEPFQTRNAMLKFLINENRIGAIAIESGLIEGKLMFDFVDGKDISLDSVINEGIACNFGEFVPNHELLIWLREYNMNQTEDQKIHMYGYDIPGCAPNPMLENAQIGFEYVFKYLDRVDIQTSRKHQGELSKILPLLHMKDNADDGGLHFWDIDSTDWDHIFSAVDDIEKTFSNNETAYITLSSAEEFEWAKQSIVGARQNVAFLHSIGNSTYDYSPREKGQLENVQWILDREEGRSVALFAHIAHLAKEIHMQEPGAMAVPMAGEHIAEKYNDEYVVIGNFYRKLDWFEEGSLELNDSLIANKLSEYEMQNFYMKLDKSDTIWQKEWPFGKPSSGGQVYLNPAESIDIILYNDVQTWLYKYQDEED